MSLTGLLCAVIPGPCGCLEFVDLLQAILFSAGSQALLSFKLSSFFVAAVMVFGDFNGSPVQSNIMIAGAVQHFSILK